MKDSCRVCMKCEEDMSSIFEEPERLYDKLQYCTGLLMTQDDGKPDQICTECSQNLEIAHKFKTDCLRSDETFHLALLQGIIGIKKESYEHSSWQDEVEPVKSEVKMESPMIEVPVLIMKNNDGYGVKKEKKKRGRPPKPKIKTEPINKKTKSTKIKDAKSQKDRKQRNISLKCGKCQIQFETTKELAKHKWRNHRKKWICELCGKELSTSKKSHLKFHQPPQYQCDNCPYRAYDKPDLAKHMYIHLGKKKYSCDQCPNTAYHFPSNLRAHIRSVHLKERNHQCDVCGNNYFTSYALKRHSDTHTEIKRYRCHICQRLYSRRQRWKDHLKNEHGVTLPRGKPGPKPKYDKESALTQQLTMNSALEKGEDPGGALLDTGLPLSLTL